MKYLDYFQNQKLYSKSYRGNSYTKQCAAKELALLILRPKKTFSSIFLISFLEDDILKMLSSTQKDKDTDSTRENEEDQEDGTGAARRNTSAAINTRKL